MLFFNSRVNNHVPGSSILIENYSVHTSHPQKPDPGSIFQKNSWRELRDGSKTRLESVRQHRFVNEKRERKREREREREIE
ncbi:hypothetical protein DK846_12840 [Methanospirillum lacunae]|uniref:Uncharacterized protein n=1 Tax=Methanospirillum lacunae TaxID=668570 RepID=A0A2V2MRX7_9EURY|nr:hypothetical protein DK846_12840 [Methanospirillum lacunae]